MGEAKGGEAVGLGGFFVVVGGDVDAGWHGAGVVEECFEGDVHLEELAGEVVDGVE